MTTSVEPESTLDRAAIALSQGLARRMSRRSAVSKLARYGAALTVGAAGAALLEAQPALAACPSGCCGCRGSCCNCSSYWCGLGGSCPSYTCRCGAWYAGCRCSNGARLMYGDCCGNCGGGSYCNCASGGCDNGQCAPGSCSPCPNCCHQLQWYSDPNRACGTCNSGSPWYVNCRRAFCES